MRVPPAVVVIGAVVFKIWLVSRIMTPREWAHVTCIVAMFFMIAVMAAIWMKRVEEPRHRPAEFICSDPAQRNPSYDYELCEFKLRNVRLGHSAHLRDTLAASPI